MNPKNTSFTAYDVLGYFVPGAVLLLSIHFSILFHHADDRSYDALLKVFGNVQAGLLVPFLILSYLAGHILGFMSSVTLQRYAIWAYGVPSQILLGYSSHGYFDPQTSKPWLSNIFRALVFILIIPISFPDLIFGKFLDMRSNYLKRFDNILINVVKSKLISILNKEIQSDDSDLESLPDPRKNDYLKLVFHHAIERAPNHVSSLRNHVVLYGYLRASALVMVISFWASTLHFLCTDTPLWPSILIIFGYGSLSFLLFIAYFRLYKRYAEECFMAIATIETSAQKGEAGEIH